MLGTLMEQNTHMRQRTTAYTRRGVTRCKSIDLPGLQPQCLLAGTAEPDSPETDTRVPQFWHEIRAENGVY